mgnify:CR=1
MQQTTDQAQAQTHALLIALTDRAANAAQLNFSKEMKVEVAAHLRDALEALEVLGEPA